MKLLTLALACGVACEAAKVPTWKCALESCALKSPLASAGPGFHDKAIVGGKACPLVPLGIEAAPTKQQFVQNVQSMDQVVAMSATDRRAQLSKMQQKWKSEAGAEAKRPSVDVAEPGVEAVNAQQWSELRTFNEFDFLVTFYAPWCGHCKTFVTAENAPINALSESLEKKNGPKVLKFDATASDAPMTITSVPTVYLFKKTGEAIQFKGDPHNVESLMIFALDGPKPAAALIAKKVAPRAAKNATAPAWRCALEDCALKSPLATSGPGFPDGLRFFAAGITGKDTRRGCPFGGPSGPEPSKKEYLKYMRGLSKVGEMNSAERRAYAIANQDSWLDEEEGVEVIKEPTVDIAAPGVETVTNTQWSELRKANKYDMLITFYAAWCPHCKAFVLGENAPIKALSASLEKAQGAKVVAFDIDDTSPPLSITGVPTVFLFKTSGEAIEFEGNPHDVAGLMAWTLEHKTPVKETKLVEVAQHLRKQAA